jgi:hypothetical protein
MTQGGHVLAWCSGPYSNIPTRATNPYPNTAVQATVITNPRIRNADGQMR